MNSTLLVLRLVPGLLLIGHGLQKLVPPRFSPPLLHATRLRATGAAFEQIGIRPALWSALVAGLSEVLGGSSFAGGLLTPVGTILIGAVMTTAILTAHARNGIWSQEAGLSSR
jgi:putative oxidoreductase